jgi:DNA-binding NtrC family response regulator
MDETRMPIVLLVEDDALVRACLAMMLKHSSFELLVCSQGTDALAVSKTLDRAVDVLVTDIVMPKLRGDELAQALRVASPGLKTVFMTGYLPDAPRLQPLIERNEQILYKPFDPDLLIRTVLNALGQPHRDPRLAVA